MISKRPLVSIGLPVFNGEHYLRQAISSILNQTLKDFEIIISDNCSTDKTAEICSEFALKDQRVKYYAQTTNKGAGPNYNFVFTKSSGKYFKWAAHDDFMSTNALESCVAVLENDPYAVLSFPLLVDVDSLGNEIEVFDRGRQGEAPVHQRFWAFIDGLHNCAEIFGVIRSSILQKTKLIRDYTDSDRTLLGELALRGRIIQVSSSRFYRRVHAGKSDRVYRNYWERSEWFNPKNKGKVPLVAFQQVSDWVRAIVLSPISIDEKIRCLYLLAKMVRWKWKLYAFELHLLAADIERRLCLNPKNN
ncbi:MAG: glycosyltransferase family 2 protein [Pseudomonadota bacterium]